MNKTLTRIAIIGVIVLAVFVAGFLFAPKLLRAHIQSPVPERVNDALKEIQWNNQLLVGEVATVKAFLGANTADLFEIKQKYERHADKVGLLVRQVIDEINSSNVRNDSLTMQLADVDNETKQLLFAVQSITIDKAGFDWASAVVKLYNSARQDWDVFLSDKDKKREVTINIIKKMLLPTWDRIAPHL